VDQTRGYRFLYALPFTDTELMVEDTYYSTSPTLDVPLLRGRIDSYLTGKGWQGGELAGEETGVLPVVLGGAVDSLWTGEPVARLGVRGGFFHPTTGYSLPDAVSNAALLAGRGDFRTAALHAFYRDRARSLWSQRSFYRLLNRMLFRAAAPRDRYRVLEHFYRLPEARIARFYAGRSTLLDRLRILSGKPPVPIRRALAAIRGTAI
jgi:lycopene beta-cyclase